MADVVGPIQIKRGTSTQWAATNVPLRAGELGIDTTRRRMKIGDGGSAWEDLPWASSDPELIAQLEEIASEVSEMAGAIVKDARTAAREVAQEELVDVVTGNTQAGVGYTGDAAGGFVGENGRETDLVVDGYGRVPLRVLEQWAPRMVAALRAAGLLGGAIDGNPNGIAGGIAGQNGRATDLVVTGDGSVPDSVLLGRWLPRLATGLLGLLPPSEAALTPYLDSARNLFAMRRDGGIQSVASLSNRVAAWGDSLTEGWPKPPFSSDKSDSWPGVLDAGWAGSVYNGGATGQSADEIALRQGGYVFVCDAFTIPASGSVAVPNTTQSFAWRVDRGWSCVGTIGGVSGTLTRGGNSTSLTFTRAASGAEAAIPAGTPFISTAGEEQKNAIGIYFAGRNDIGYTSSAGPVRNRVIAAHIAMAERPGPAHKRFLTVGTITTTGEMSGSSTHSDVLAINNTLASLYPDNYFDLRGYLVKQAIYDMGLTPTATDLGRMNADTLPPQIMANYNSSDGSHDVTHYSPAAAAAVAAKLKSVMTAKGWLI